MTWIDMGDGTAIDASRVGRLVVYPPWRPSMLRMRTFAEQLQWTVEVLHGQTLRLIGFHWSEDDARAHARDIVTRMLQAADRVQGDD